MVRSEIISKLSNKIHETEASGGVTLQNVRKIASTGVKRISVGQITHSAPSIDFNLKINSKNLILGSIIMIPLCIPVIIFSIGAITNDQELFTAQINILLSIFFASLAIGPWVISGCIKIALKN